MEDRGWMMLKVLINRYNPKAGNSLLKFLPEADSKKISTQEIQSSDLTPIFNQPENIVGIVHYSWLDSFLKKFPDSVHPYIFSALNPAQLPTNQANF